MVRRFHTRAQITGEIRLPAVPGLLDEYVSMCADVFAGLGKPFSDPELSRLKEVLESQLAAAYAESEHSQILIAYDAPAGPTLNYHIRTECQSVSAAGESWLSTRKPPPRGTEPEARVWQLASKARDPKVHRVLVIGDRAGGNALALARRGHPVDVVGTSPELIEKLRSEVDRESLNMHVIQRDTFADADDLRDDYQLMVLSEVVTNFRSTQQLRDLFELAARCLAPGGRLVFNSFLPRIGYQPDIAAREFCQQVKSSLFTRAEMASAAGSLPLTLLSDESVYDYEKTYLPEGAWPPTSWYREWISGIDAFATSRADSPMELRWLIYQRTDAQVP
ncbi:MAG: class I SAM-dependent methyltransferase [Actinomycetota bacterium]|nr:class I SAM-dependent methyltransferase [Actinomycetota bacterium]